MLDLSEIPGQILLDTCTVNFILDNGEEIFDGVAVADDVDNRVQEDIDALRGMFATGRRASWQLSISPFTYVEVQRTTDQQRRFYLATWLMEL